MATLAALSMAGGAVIVFAAERLDFTLLLLLVAAMPAALYALPALPLAGLKIGRLLGQLRWWHLLWLMLFLSGLTFRIRGVEDIQDNPLDPMAINRVVLVGTVGLVLLGAFSVRRGPGIHNLFSGGIGWLTVYALFGTLSTMWSVYPGWTFYKSLEYFVDVALIAAIVSGVHSTVQFKTLFDWTWLLYGLVLLSVWVGVVLWPDQAVQRYEALLPVQIQGVIPVISANGVGTIASTLGTVAVVRLLTRERKDHLYRLVLALSILSLLFAQTRSAWLAFLIALAVILGLRYRFKMWLMLLFLLAFFTLTVVTGPFAHLLWDYFRRGQDASAILTLTGRLNLWKIAWDFIMNRPWSGYGALTGTRFLVAQFDPYGEGAIISGADNVFLEVLLGTGVIGLILLTGSILQTWRHLWRRLNGSIQFAENGLVLEALGVLVVLLVRGWFSAGPFIWHPPLTWLVVLGYAQQLRSNFVRREGASFAGQR